MILPAQLPSATVSQPYSYQVTATGGQAPLSFALAGGSLPPGVTLDRNGRITGVPSSPGSYQFTIQIQDSCAAGSQTAVGSSVLNVAPPPVSGLSVTVSPSKATIARGLPATLNLTYTFTGSAGISALLTSSGGTFIANGRNIGSGGVPLTAQISNGRGTARETLGVPIAVIRRAERAGTTRIFFTRTFAGGGYSVTAQMEIDVTTETGAAFKITRVRLFFSNNRAETTVQLHSPPPKLSAEVRFVGSGLLRGYWEVDGRRLADVFKHLTYGRSVILEVPRTAPLPTFDPGTHRVRLVITSPWPPFQLPEAIYYVTAKRYVKTSINLVYPEDGNSIGKEKLEFSWRRNGGGIYAYLIEFLPAPGKRPLFSAYVKGTSYKLPQKVVSSYFEPGNTYYWRVKGYGEYGQLLAESPLHTFSLTAEEGFVPGQILLAWKEGQGRSMARELERRYGLQLLYQFRLKAIGLHCAVFSTNGKPVKDVVKAVEKGMVREGSLVHAGPNYIYPLSLEPLWNKQALAELIELPDLRRLGTGAGAKVAVIDTGVDYTHKDLAGRVEVHRNFVGNEEYQREIHGTAVAGVIAAERNGFGTEGIAPDAKILALRGCSQITPNRPEGRCFSDSVARAVDFAIASGARVVNMSFGSSHPDGLITRLIAAGTAKGILFVAPVGNDPEAKRLPFPASMKEVVAVGGADQSGKPYPNRSLCEKADVVAPCSNIFAPIPGNRFNFLNGTSLSSAMISGLLALRPEAIRKNGDKPLDFKTLAFSSRPGK